MFRSCLDNGFYREPATRKQFYKEITIFSLIWSATKDRFSSYIIAYTHSFALILDGFKPVLLQSVKHLRMLSYRWFWEFYTFKMD